VISASAQEIMGVWSFLPYAYAASFGNEIWKATAYNQKEDGTLIIILIHITATVILHHIWVCVELALFLIFA
jgi:hypothetical protein